LHLIAEDNEWHLCLSEAVHDQLPRQLRALLGSLTKLSPTIRDVMEGAKNSAAALLVLMYSSALFCTIFLANAGGAPPLPTSSALPAAPTGVTAAVVHGSSWENLVRVSFKISEPVPSNDNILFCAVTSSSGENSFSEICTSFMELIEPSSAGTFTYTVAFFNQHGESLSSIASNAVTFTDSVMYEVRTTVASTATEVNASTTIAMEQTVPDAPTNVIAAMVSQSQGIVLISFTVPSFDGGASILFYKVQSSSGVSSAGHASPVLISNEHVEGIYTYAVTALNKKGSSSASKHSNAINFQMQDL
jgi:hypothetical protein